MLFTAVADPTGGTFSLMERVLLVSHRKMGPSNDNA
jgi:hypothetical protein